MSRLLDLAVQHWPLAIIAALVVWIAVAVAVSPLVVKLLGANGTRPEEDEEQWRWVLERTFIRALDNRARRANHQVAWELAEKAARRPPGSTHNLKAWSNPELLRAIHELKV